MKGINWLIEVLNNVRPDEFCSIEKVKELCYQAKEMEKEQRMYSEEEVYNIIIRLFDNHASNYTDAAVEDFDENLKKQ